MIGVAARLELQIINGSARLKELVISLDDVLELAIIHKVHCVYGEGCEPTLDELMRGIRAGRACYRDLPIRVEGHLH